jgi:signal transduction histidine kinase/ActR/RegA family two-component response regulator
MDETKRARLDKRLSMISRGAGALAVAVGLAVWCGWIFDIAALRSIFPGFPEMKFNAALAFVLAGASLFLLTFDSSTLNTTARACAGAVALIGLLTLSQYIVGWDLGIDQLLIDDHSRTDPHPGRIPVAGSFNFLALGAIFLLVDAASSSARRFAQLLALLVASVSFVVILGYAYDASSLYRPGSSNPVVLHGAILFVLLSLGVLLARSHLDVMSRVLAADTSGLLIRRLLPAALILPPVIGWLRLQGEHAGLYGADVGLALYATANVLILSVLIWATAAEVQRADANRCIADLKLRTQLARLDLLNHITHAIAEKQDLRSIFQVVLRTLQDHLTIDLGCIARYEPANETLTIESVSVSGEALARSMPEGERLLIDKNGLSRCVRGALVYEPDVAQVPYSFPQRLARAGLHAFVAAPLPLESSVFGVLVAARREAGSFTSSDCEFLRQLGEHVALAAHQAQLHGALQRAYDDLRQSQQTVLQQERLRALGQMASGIAHDINNALSPISLYAESLREHEPNLSETGRQHLATIQRAIDDVANTIGRMREFYRPRELQREHTPINLNRLVDQVLALTRARWRDLPQERGIVINVRTELTDPAPDIQGVETEIRDALTNLIFNAVDAMPDGGTLTVCTQVLKQGGRATRLSLEVRDTGIGMDEEARQRCLEPFFTTKGERGTGLGLAMVYGMANRHGADLEIESVVATGTVVRLGFPLAEAASAIAEPSPPIAPARSLRLLLVDDDPLVTQALQHALERDGHSIAVAEGGQEGIDACLAAQKRGEPFDIVITDLGMPYVDGRKVAAAIRARLPRMPVILLTGWGQGLLSENEPPPGVDRVLSKPPKILELRRALAELT